MTPPSIADVLSRAADLIEPEGAWCRDPFAMTAGGTELLYGGEKGAVSWCAVGAIEHVIGRVPDSGLEVEGLYTAVAEFAGGDAALLNLNDELGQRGAVAKLREAAAKAREQGL